MQKQRRDFLKITAAGAAGLALARTNRAFAAWPSTGTLAVNPNISNMRVVACYDTKMMTTPTSTTFAPENAAVDSARVQANMDAMAMQLANQPTADAAWKAIFRSGKAWASTRVAIKVNTIEPMNMARLAVLQKFCTVFAGFGVPAANIIIYDGNSTYGAGISNYTSHFSTTDTTKIQAVVSSLNTALGGTTNAPLPDGSSAACTADIANGKIDVLVNIANNKGHTLMGKATLSMKNHFGTFAPKHDNNYAFSINKSDAILGGNPVRQQLCFIDSLLANKRSNTGSPEVMPNYLIMGVFGPAVDYLTVKKVREAVMGCTHDAATIDSYVTSFGYATTDPVWVVVPPAGGSTNADGGASPDGAGGSGGTSGAADAGAGGTGGAAGRGGGGTSGGGGRGGGGTSGAAGASGGGTSGAAGSSAGGTSGGGGKGGGGTSGAAGASGGGTSGAPGANAGGTSGATSGGGGGTIASGGTTSGGGAGGAGGTATSAPLASGGVAMTGETSAGAGSAVSAAGGSGGATEPTSGAVNAGKSGGGCDVAGGKRRATGWGAMLAFGAVVAEKLRRLLSDSDRSS
jgi:hypothetical protein